jgi:hypothetical protein
MGTFFLGPPPTLRQHRQNIGSKQHTNQEQLQRQLLHFQSPLWIGQPVPDVQFPHQSHLDLSFGKGRTICAKEHAQREISATYWNYYVLFHGADHAYKEGSQCCGFVRESLHKDRCKCRKSARQAKSQCGICPSAHDSVQLHRIVCTGNYKETEEGGVQDLTRHLKKFKQEKARVSMSRLRTKVANEEAHSEVKSDPITPILDGGKAN